MSRIELRDTIYKLQVNITRYKSLIKATEINIINEKKKLCNTYRSPEYLWMMRDELKGYIYMLKIYKEYLHKYMRKYSLN